MMAMPAKKKPDLAMVIDLGKPKKDAGVDAPSPEDAGDTESAQADAMDEFSGAIASKDNGKAIEALKVLFDLFASDKKDAGDEETIEAK